MSHELGRQAGPPKLRCNEELREFCMRCEIEGGRHPHASESSQLIPDFRDHEGLMTLRLSKSASDRGLSNRLAEVRSVERLEKRDQRKLILDSYRAQTGARDVWV